MDDDRGELTGEEWRQWMADRLAARAGTVRKPDTNRGRTTTRAAARDAARSRIETDATLAQYDRPRTRGDCVGGPRPCPWAGCRYHLYLDVNPDTGSIKIHFAELTEMDPSCALDLADDGGMTLEAVADVIGVVRERVRQLEDDGKRMLAAVARRRGLAQAL